VTINEHGNAEDRARKPKLAIMVSSVISPLEHGYGVTLGNALRRVLLSSLEGAAGDVYPNRGCFA